MVKLMVLRLLLFLKYTWTKPSNSQVYLSFANFYLQVALKKFDKVVRFSKITVWNKNRIKKVQEKF